MSEGKTPKVSVITPVYNTREEYLREAIESILNQTFRDFEFILLNDGSTNNAEDVILSYKDERIKYIKHDKNEGLPKSRNDLLDASNGEYIAGMDSDDISLPKRLEIQVDFMNKHQDIGVSSSAFEFFGRKNYVVYMPKSEEDIFYNLKIGSAPITNGVSIIRKSVIGDTRYDEKYAYSEDYKFWCDLYEKTKFANLDDILMKYRWHRTNTSRKNTIKQSIETQVIIYKNMEKYCNQDCSIELKILEKIKNNKRITTKEYKKLLEKENIIEANHTFKRAARQKCWNPLIALGLTR